MPTFCPSGLQRLALSGAATRSGGSAVALATAMVPLATGSDMGGSLRNPGAYCAAHAQLYVEEINGACLRTYFHWLALAYGLTLASHPVACIPCGRDHTGMPLGIQVCGRRFGDRRALAIAAALERFLQCIAGLARPVPDFGARAACPPLRSGALA